MMSVLDSVIDRVGEYLGVSKPKDLLPEADGWSADQEDGGPIRIRVGVEAATLEDDLKKDGASDPSRAFCLAAWLSSMGEPSRAEIVVTGAGFRQSPAMRRAVFVLNEYETLLPRLMSVSSGAAWRWPTDPVFNVERSRSLRKPARGREGKLARVLAGDRELRQTLEVLDGPVEPLRELLPVGLYDDSVSPDTHWTPAGKSAIDLWTRTRDRKIMHLFELHAGRKGPVGILAEALYYARMLGYVRDRRTIEYAPQADGMSAARNCREIKMWLATANMHPLVWHPKRGSAPIEQLNAALTRRRVSFGVMPVTPDPPALHVEQRWPVVKV